jgi:hypothetical protein
MNFCTVFDSGYISRGIALYNSLVNTCADSYFSLYVVCTDQQCYNILTELNKPGIIPIHLENELEDDAIREARGNRTWREYCWTLSACSIWHCIKTYQLDSCTYLDADIYFYQSPQIILDELEDNSVLLTDHFFAPEFNEGENAGKYCVQFVAFKNDVNGMKALEYWRSSNIEWCYAKFEDDKFGDQKYLEHLERNFGNVVISNNIGGGIAPWNVCKYNFIEDEPNLEIQFENQKSVPVYYHFHHFTFHYYNYHLLGIKLFTRRDIEYSKFNYYTISPQVKRLFYDAYKNQILNIEKVLNDNYGKNHNFNKGPIEEVNILTSLKNKILTLS